MDNPLIIFVICFIALFLSTETGAYLREKNPRLAESEREVMGVLLTGLLTLFAIIIGFTFSMAAGRYDQRKNLEESEANAIGTEYLRVGLLPPSDTARARSLLRSYLDQRILFYTVRDTQQLVRVSAATLKLQDQLWSVVEGPSAAEPTPVAATILTGMNDVLNSQGYTQAMWWNHIPTAAWVFVLATSLVCTVLSGYYIRRDESKLLFFSLPVLVAISFFLVAELDTPRTGGIRVLPQNLLALAAELKG